MKQTGRPFSRAIFFIALAALAPLLAISGTATAQLGQTPILFTDEVTIVGPLGTSFDPTPAPFAPFGTYDISGTGRNDSDLVLANLAVVVHDITGGNVVFGCEGGVPQGPGCLLPIPPSALGPDGLLFPGELFSAGATVGLVGPLPFSADFQLQGIIVAPTSLGVTPNPVTLTSIGQTQQLQVTANFPGGGSLDVTDPSRGTTYTGNDTGVAGVDADGLITAVGNGNTQIIVEHSDIQVLVPLDVVVDLSAPTTIEVFPDPIPSLFFGETQQLQVLGDFSGAPNVDITNDPNTTFTSDDDTIVSVDPNGLLTANGLGTTQIFVGRLDDPLLLLPLEVQSILGPPLGLNTFPLLIPPMAPGDNLQLQVVGDFPGGNTLDVTNSSTGTTYVSGDDGIVTVDENGLITAINLGSTTILITNQGVEIVHNVDVTLGPPLGLNVLPLPIPPILPGDNLQLQVLGDFPGGNTLDVTNSSTGTTYVSNNTDVVIVDENGLVTGVSIGNTTIQIFNQGVQTIVPIGVITDIGGPPAGS